MDAFVDKWDNKYINFLTDIYDTMRQGADTRIFFYEIFQPAYTIRRGRCFKTAVALYQKSLDELGKFRVQLRKPAVMNFSRAPESAFEMFSTNKSRQEMSLKSNLNVSR
uniref:DOCKER domain-containing protein n=1 Tax=Ascaris lumbricoides TaxID=6252 RepID=A0A0M3HGL8_ASCLU